MKQDKLVPVLRFKDDNGKWTSNTLNNITKIYDGTHSTPNYVSSGIPFYSVEHLTANQFERTKYITEEVWIKENKRVKLETNDILMTRIGDIGTARLIDWDVNASFYVSLALIKQNNSFISSFLVQSIASEYFQRELWRRIIHVAFPKKINLGEIGRCLINLPSLPEQQKISDFLASVDDKIQALTRKVNLLKDYKKGVMQKIFKQEIRFKNDDGEEFGEWENIQLGNLTTKTGKKNKENIQYPIYSINNKEGFLPQSDQFKGMDSNDRGYDISLYKIIKEKTFAYNPARINVGSIGYSGNLNNIIISSLYVCFTTNDSVYDLFLLQYLNTYNFNKAVLRNVEGGVRQYLFYDNFSTIKMPLPQIEEQVKITNYLSTIDQKIKTTEHRLEKMNEWKKGLLQKMFV